MALAWAAAKTKPPRREAGAVRDHVAKNAVRLLELPAQRDGDDRFDRLPVTLSGLHLEEARHLDGRFPKTVPLGALRHRAAVGERSGDRHRALDRRSAFLFHPLSAVR